MFGPGDPAVDAERGVVDDHETTISDRCPGSKRLGGVRGFRMSGAILFERDHVEQLDDLGERPKRLRGGRLLWVDVDRESAEEAQRVAAAFGLDSATQQC